jgi:hypothetical protein
MADELRRQLREVEQALVTPEGVIAVPREYISLLQRLGSRDKELASLDALVTAWPAGHKPPACSRASVTRPHGSGLAFAAATSGFASRLK